jgi:hypothetical protein
MTVNRPNLFSPRNLARAKKRVQKMLQRVKQAYIGGKMKRYRRLIVELLRSIDARVVAVDKAYHALDPSRRPGKKQLASIAEPIRPWQASDELSVNSMVRGSQC